MHCHITDRYYKINSLCVEVDSGAISINAEVMLVCGCQNITGMENAKKKKKVSGRMLIL